MKSVISHILELISPFYLCACGMPIGHPFQHVCICILCVITSFSKYTIKKQNKTIIISMCFISCEMHMREWITYKYHHFSHPCAADAHTLFPLHTRKSYCFQTFFSVPTPNLMRHRNHEYYPLIILKYMLFAYICRRIHVCVFRSFYLIVWCTCECVCLCFATVCAITSIATFFKATEKLHKSQTDKYRWMKISSQTATLATTHT